MKGSGRNRDKATTRCDDQRHGVQLDILDSPHVIGISDQNHRHLRGMNVLWWDGHVNGQVISSLQEELGRVGTFRRPPRGSVRSRWAGAVARRGSL